MKNIKNIKFFFVGAIYKMAEVNEYKPMNTKIEAQIEAL